MASVLGKIKPCEFKHGTAKMVCEKLGDNKIKVVFDIPETNMFGYAADTKMKLNSDKLKNLGWMPQIGLEEAYRRMMKSMACNEITE